MPLTGFQWGLQVLKDHQHFFRTLDAYVASLIDTSTPVSSGQIWYAIPDGSYVMLVGKEHPDDHKRDAIQQCVGVIEDGEWKPIPDRLPGPCPWEIHFVDEWPPHFDPEHKRPGLVLCEPRSRTATSTPLLRFQRALWVRVESKVLDQHGRLRVRGANARSPRKNGAFPFWTAWAISSEHKEDLLHPVGALSSCTSVDHPYDPLHDVAAGLLAELLGVRKWSSDTRPPRRAKKPIPRRGEIVLIRFDLGGSPTPCLVVSPDEFNRSYDDMVVLQCLPYKAGDEHKGAIVSLPSDFMLDNRRWTIDLTLVRGIAFAERYFDPCSPERRYLDDGTFAKVESRLKSLYA